MSQLRRLRYLSNTSGLLLLLPLAIGLETVNYLDRNRPWRDDFFWASDWAGTSVFLVAPFLAAIVALDVGILVAPSRRDLNLSVPRQAVALLRPAVIGTAICAVVHLLFVGIYAVSARPSASLLSDSLIVVGTQVLLLAMFALVGAILGAFARLPWAPVLALVLVPAAMWFFGRSTGVFTPLDVGGSTSSLLGFELNARFAIAQVGWLLAAVAVLAGLLHMRWPWTRRPSLLTVTPLLALGVALVLLRQPSDFERLNVLTVTPQRQCIGQEPRVCAFPEHRRFAAEVLTNAERIYRGLPAEARDVLPTELAERTPGGPVPTDPRVSAFEVLPESFSSDSIALEDTAASLATPWSCPQIFASAAPPEAYFTTSQFLSDVLVAAGRGETPLANASATTRFLEAYDEIQSCRVFS